ncbi:PKD domain-containing protein [Hymenobacter qilianensis]|uniref:PKD domain-containing protein n=1 Tax=Hymenobacter qilianensis TaxID=1385715 RepID=A0A7H0GSB8_9BACT|nr:PKD domain-containing protein [Hymenobacter qilianensis]QNP51184.1 PKD domain-containing protein [Hymenobacter qilianensis]
MTAADGTLNLAFSALASEGGVDNAKVSAIEVYSVSSTTPTNPAPVANAGADKTITLPTNSVVLTGSGTDDGSIAGYSWSQVGTTPSTATLSGANTASLTASGLVAGTYTFALVVTDNLGKASAADQVVVTVNSTTTPTNPAPVANAGPDKTITLPTNSVVLTGSGTDDGSIKSYAWTQASGPSTATLSGVNTANLTASSLVSGSYVFSLTVTDNLDKASAADQVTVTVNPATTTPPPRARRYTG